MHLTVDDLPTPRGSNETIANLSHSVVRSGTNVGRKLRPDPPEPPGSVRTDSLPSAEPLNARISAMSNVLPLLASFQSCRTLTVAQSKLIDDGILMPDLSANASASLRQSDQVSPAPVVLGRGGVR